MARLIEQYDDVAKRLRFAVVSPVWSGDYSDLIAEAKAELVARGYDPIADFAGVKAPRQKQPRLEPLIVPEGMDKMAFAEKRARQARLPLELVLSRIDQPPEEPDVVFDPQPIPAPAGYVHKS